MKLSTAIIIFSFGIILTLINHSARAVETASLEIDTEEECKALGGVWDPPQCEGIVPDEAQNLSEIHNPTIGHQVKTNENNGEENKQGKLKQDAVQEDTVKQEPSNAKQTTVNKTFLILYVILGLLLLSVFIFIKNKQKNESS